MNQEEWDIFRSEEARTEQIPFYEGKIMARGPQTIGNVLSELIARSGLGRVQTAANYEVAWREAAGPMAAKYTRPGQLRRGTLEVVVANSTLVQELGFQKIALLKSLEASLPDEKIENLRFRVGSIE
jgi:predicted nucleic acid-binding Zn ribbon protein